jgi:hypothetical protein
MKKKEIKQNSIPARAGRPASAVHRVSANILQMLFDRTRSNNQLIGYFLIREALGKHVQNFQLAPGKRINQRFSGG